MLTDRSLDAYSRVQCRVGTAGVACGLTPRITRVGIRPSFRGAPAPARLDLGEKLASPTNGAGADAILALYGQRGGLPQGWLGGGSGFAALMAMHLRQSGSTMPSPPGAILQLGSLPAGNAIVSD